ncbi:GNAT family N-acetyltransferase [Aneurinibacillus danicus]|uniref:N-acetyltransferase n=1 Tax=Aneurinibacillus danicus TaxID=267746 RepID=A0A511V4V6_9BACL|nr:GNAT family N-acetyltransferase [Aneurinibacillus danicus]GEN32803.1 N-acetyltransferase [Aneurinibacillus danicus]
MPIYKVKRVHNEAEKEGALNVRRRVFIEEQNVPEELEVDEHDSLDASTIHILATNEQGEAVGAGRLREYKPGIGKIERVAVLSSCRGHGLGRLLMEKLEAEAKENGYGTLKLNAQLQAQPFYERLGYKPHGDTFIDANIEHIAMIKTI